MTWSVLELLFDPLLLPDDDGEGEEEQDKEPGCRRGVGGAREAGLPLHDDHVEDVRGERDGDVEQAEEHVAASSTAARAPLRPVIIWRHDADGDEEHDGDGCWNPAVAAGPWNERRSWSAVTAARAQALEHTHETG